MWLLGWISLLTDTASEAIYPILPLFLTHTLGAGVVSIGVVEGVAEATASGLKVGSGYLSDRSQRRRVLVQVGYGLSSGIRPLIGLAGTWGHVLALRFADRVGKGVRSAPRDAMLAAASPASIRGRVFGAHRAMDHVGAILGPLLAAAFLWQWPGQMRALFLATLVPSALVVLLLFRLPPDERSVGPIRSGALPATDASGVPRLPRSFYRLLSVLLVFTLGNSSDAFLLLQLSALGVAAPVVPLLWAALHVVKAATSVGGGLLADRFGRRAVIGAGWAIYALVYAGFARLQSLGAVVSLFLVYGVYFGLTEGAEKALVTDLTPAALRGTAFGWYYAGTGLGALVASVLFGLLWHVFGSEVAFGLGALLAVTATVMLPWVKLSES